jgi:hypothetical protein
MFFASLTPYVTVGLFFFLIMVVSGLVTMLLLPALTALRPGLFYPVRGNAGHSKVAAAAAVPLALVMALGAAGIGTPDVAMAQDVDPVEIMKTAHMNLYYAGDDGVANVHMALVDKKGKERVREFTMIRWDKEDGGEQRYYTYFIKPNDVRRTSFMVIKHQDKDDDRWIYVPAVDLVRRLSANDKNSSFVGSDFSYEDVSGRHWLDDTHEFVRDDELDGKAVHVIKSVPKQKANWDYRIAYIDKEQLLPLKEEYFKKEKLIRVFTADTIEEIGGFMTVTQRTMKDMKKNHATTVTFSEVQYDVGVSPDIFTERYLKNPPREYIQ